MGKGTDYFKPKVARPDATAVNPPEMEKTVRMGKLVEDPQTPADSANWKATGIVRMSRKPVIDLQKKKK